MSKKGLSVYAMIVTVSLALNAQEYHTFATCNVRYTNAAADSCQRSWGERGRYVVQTITDYDFDIVGMQEVSGHKGDRSWTSDGTKSGLSQYQDLQQRMPQYEFIAYERDGNDAGVDYSYNAIAYKRDRYEVIATDCFWLSDTPEKASFGWAYNTDGTFKFKRTCAWAKMREKATGKEFYFAVTHCNYAPSIDGPKGARLIVERLSAMAGDLPVVLVGDFNMHKINHWNAYREYISYFSDASTSSCRYLSLPEANGQTAWTTTQWTPITEAENGQAYDYLFYRNMHAHQYSIITENYGRPLNPSDHYPVMVKFSFADECKTKCRK